MPSYEWRIKPLTFHWKERRERGRGEGKKREKNRGWGENQITIFPPERKEKKEGEKRGRGERKKEGRGEIKSLVFSLEIPHLNDYTIVLQAFLV